MRAIQRNCGKISELNIRHRTVPCPVVNGDIGENIERYVSDRFNIFVSLEKSHSKLYN